MTSFIQWPFQIYRLLQKKSWLFASTLPYMLHAATTADSLWAAEQILRAGIAAALLFWLQKVRPKALRRLHLAAMFSPAHVYKF
ncbi:hypothetical protein [Paraburkholderia sp. J7]|uniref:hypothetical protein n=1 Tax=Paraburkholderia sp. J7 TaxID=2805438 RepID=UPI0039EE8858